MNRLALLHTYRRRPDSEQPGLARLVACASSGEARQRVDRSPAQPDFEMQVWTGGMAGCADEAETGACCDLFANVCVDA